MNKIKNNIFDVYEQTENQITKALINTLEYSKIDILNQFLRKLNVSPISCDISEVDFQIQSQSRFSVPDATIIEPKKLFIHIESKIVRYTISNEQINNHIKDLKKKARSYPTKYLILITPDDPEAQEICRLVRTHSPLLKFISWKDILEFLNSLSNLDQKSAFLVEQLKFFINDNIQDLSTGRESIVGVIANYVPRRGEGWLDQVRRGQMRTWGSPTGKRYRGLEYEGRYLLIYHTGKRKIIGEAKIIKHEHRTDGWYYYFNKFIFYNNPVALNEIISGEPLQRFRTHVAITKLNLREIRGLANRKSFE